VKFQIIVIISLAFIPTPVTIIVFEQLTVKRWRLKRRNLFVALNWCLLLTCNIYEHEVHCIFRSYIYIIFQVFSSCFTWFLTVGKHTHSFMWKWILILTG